MKTPTNREAVRNMVQQAITDPTKPGIVVHFHGGLVNYDAGVEIANRLNEEYRQVGTAPFFFVYEAGLLETFRNNLGELAKEKLFKILWKRVAEIAKRKALQTLGLKSTGQLPGVDVFEMNKAIELALDGNMEPIVQDPLFVVDGWTELTEVEEVALEDELMSDELLREAIDEVSNGLRTPQEIEQAKITRSTTPIQASTATLMDPEAVDRYIQRQVEGTKGIINPLALIKGVVKIAYRVIRRFRNGRDHGFHATVVEEILGELYVRNIAGTAWDLMKGDSSDAFKANGAVYGGTAFLEELHQALPVGEQRRITLVGHSTGAIYIAEFLKKADAIFHDRPDVTFGVIFLAPAATFTCCRDMLTHYGHRIISMADRKRALRMFTLRDELEQGDRMLGVIYPHSMLYFVSGVAERDGFGDMPIVGMERYYDRTTYQTAIFPELDSFRNWIVPGNGAYHADHIAWSNASGTPGLATMSLKHGHFDNDRNTLDSVKYILSNNF